MTTRNGSVALVAPRPDTHRTPEENLGLGYIAAVLRNSGLQVFIIDAWLEDLSIDEVVGRVMELPDPVVVGYSSYRTTMGAAALIAERLRGKVKNQVAGGYGPTFHADDFLAAGFEFVVRGEADTSVANLFRLMLDGDRESIATLPGVSWTNEAGSTVHNPIGEPANLDDLPMPARDTVEYVIGRRTPAHLMSSRGCFASCTFCSVVAFQRETGGPQWRERSIMGIVEELQFLWDRGVRHVKVVDDSFLEPPRDLLWVRALADSLESRGIEMILRGSVRADRIDESTAVELARVGFVAMSCGVENFAPTALKRMAKRADVDQNHAALRAFESNGILVQAGLILFDHATTMDELWLNLQGFLAHPKVVTKGIFTEMYAAAGTPFTAKLRRDALLVKSESVTDMNSKYHGRSAEVDAVYGALKTWHKSHMELYDMTIDPLSAPKALSRLEMAGFETLARDLRARDLELMEHVLDESSNPALQQIVEGQISESATWYESKEQEVLKLYEFHNMVYVAESNPFVS